MKDDGLERIMRKLGEYGRYQNYQFLLHVLSAVPTSIAMLSLVTIAAVPEHRCAIEGVDTLNYTASWNSSLVTENIPTNEYGKLESCKIFGANNTIQECNSWVYDTKYYHSSRGIEWDFVCNRRWMGAAPQAIFMTGVVLGSLVLGPLCDTFGRRTIFIWTALFQLITGILSAFATEYYTFLTIRFLYGIFGISPFKAGYVLMIELIGPRKRTFCGALFQILFGVGVMLLGVWGYVIDNRFYLQIVYASHAALLLPHWFLMDESPRWLWGKGRVREAVAIVDKGLRINRSKETVDTPLIVSHYKTLCDPCVKSSTTGILDLFRTPNMARKSVIICGCWLAVYVVYYGLAINTGKLNGNPFIILFLSGFVELPGYIIGMYLVSIIGHRATLSSTMLLSGVACLVIVLLPQASTMTTVAAMIGKFIASGSFAIIYKYSAELFPTVVRSSGVGFGTMCGSISAALTPLITLLDTFKPEIPTIIFGLSGLVFGLCCMLLPETRGRKLPQTLEDGELFGLNDTCFTSCRRRGSDYSDSPDFFEPLKIDGKK
ncbi:organic cation transporter protein-like isoform X2 [Pectinophora gossypiella]|uniref:organic cation transporter protein-like isoform X2 n=1 Tax=Pectinophora gossypiella TaxID=13191 RepID=UPI00214E27D6|nr:organic cation transporter protein-like isoform X2 [Pectinophora gossypiella]XP_049870117.1 organic cation transporter protein-like isoform X2 [Pectinophora gossypiella]